LRRLALGALTAAIVTGGGDRVGVACQLLYGEGVDTGFEEGRDDGAAVGGVLAVDLTPEEGLRAP
jgi:hypothetical protein